MADAAALLRAARTLHIEGFFHPPVPAASDGPSRRVPIEFWFDVENGRMCKRLSPDYKVPEGEQPPMLGSVCDGTYEMKIGFNRPVRGKGYCTVSFTRKTPFQARVEAYRSVNEVLTQMFHVDQVEGFRRAGEEKIDGKAFAVWQGEIEGFGHQGMARIRSWLSERTGELGKVQFWQKAPGQDWQLFFEFTRIERDTAIPEDVFRTEPPTGYKLTNRKEDAPLDVLGGRYVPGAMPFALLVHIGFILPDGTVLIGWSSPEKTFLDQSALFEPLRPGGPLPGLPAVITGLEPMPNPDRVRYSGRHLAYTKKDGAFYEWGLYVPQPAAPDRRSFLTFNLLTDYNAPEAKFGSRSVGLAEDIPVGSPSDFDRWVRGAMADLSDEGAAPSGMTYEYVMDLSRRIRHAAGSQPTDGAERGRPRQ